MTTVWRPRVRIVIEDGDAEVGIQDAKDSGLTKKGTKRKIAPRHFGPCEHGVKKRSQCKVCSACLLYTSPSPRDQRGSRMPSSA